MRQEGDDPISLSVLLDVQGKDEVKLMPKMAEALAELVPQYLGPKDHVSVYALDCVLARATGNIPADADDLVASVNQLLRPWKDHIADKSVFMSAQGTSVGRGVEMMTQGRRPSGGRAKVILLMTDGRDKGSKHSWGEVRGLPTRWG